MSIPAFSIDGVVPPFVGPQGPGDDRHFMTPYEVTSLDVVTRFATTPNRREILRLWLEHRAALRSLDLHRGFQWLDGSFVEDREPNDLDVVTFLHRPAGRSDPAAFVQMFKDHPQLFSRRGTRPNYRLDAFFVDLDATIERTIDSAIYWLGLFSHRRVDSLWKGMLSVPLSCPTDGEATQSLIEDPSQDAENGAEVP